jgi:hypothetical protein
MTLAQGAAEIWHGFVTLATGLTANEERRPKAPPLPPLKPGKPFEITAIAHRCDDARA